MPLSIRPHDHVVGRTNREVLEHALGAQDRIGMLTGIVDEEPAVKDRVRVRRRIQQIQRSAERLHVVPRPELVTVAALLVGLARRIFEEQLLHRQFGRCIELCVFSSQDRTARYE